MDIRAQDFTPENFSTIIDMLPRTAREIVDVIGSDAAIALLNDRAGCEFMVPKHPDKNRLGAMGWAALVQIVGEPGMQAMAKRWGGDVLCVPTCQKARTELRHRAIRTEFDRLTISHGYSGKQAIREICLKFSPISSRSVETIINRAV